MRTTLLQRLTPAAHEQLINESKRYEYTINRIFKSLRKAHYWSDLTIDEANRLLLYSNCEKYGVERYNYRTLMYCDERIIEAENNII